MESEQEHGGLSGLSAARGIDALAAYVGVCPTCLAWDDPAAEESERLATPGRPVCPTCGLPSVEWDLASQIHATVDEHMGLEKLARAIDEVDRPAAEDRRHTTPESGRPEGAESGRPEGAESGRQACAGRATAKVKKDRPDDA